MDYEKVEGCLELRKGDVKLFNLLMREKERYYAVIDNDIIWVADSKLLESEDEDCTVGVFHYSGEEFIMAMFEYMNINAEYC